MQNLPSRSTLARASEEIPQCSKHLSVPAKQKRGRQIIITPKLAAALDKCKISDRNTVHILIATLEALGQDVESFAINRWSINNSREKLREKKATEIKNIFKDKELPAATIHWDSKLLPSLTGKETVDRLPVILSNCGADQLLGVPALQSGSGKEQATAVCETLAEWGLQDYVEALVFDTTASNTGAFNGACVLIESFLEKDLLYLPCRHHIYEIILKAVFEENMGKTTGPTVPILKKFQTAWPKINVNNFKTGIVNKKIRKHLDPVDVSRVLDFIRSTLQEQQPREDYREFLQLAAIFLGEIPSRGVSFRAPGAIHHARWMAKAIYCFKIFMFRHEFKLSTREENAICDICIFLISIYIEAWFCEPSAAKAPFSDFSVLSKIYKYRTVDEDISRVALQKIKNHLWYLSPESIALAFFDPNVTAKSKIKMVKALNRETDTECEKSIKRITVETSQVPELLNQGLEQFVSNKTNRFFTRFNINDEFLCPDPARWHKHEDFVQALKVVNKLKITNDTAERGVKLVEDFNKLYTKNERQMQYVLQVVSDYRQKFPDSNKQTISKNKDF